MKLDSIIYDTNTLSSAITEQLIAESPTFNALYPSDTSTAMVNTLAGYGSMLQYSLVSAMANCYTDTAFSEAGIRQLAETLGNRLHGNVSSSVTISITRKNLLGVTDLIIPANCTWDANGIKFYNPTAIHFGGTTDNTKNNIQLVQGEFKVHKTTSSGISNERVYFSQDFRCDNDTVKVFVNGEEWKTDVSFLPYNHNNVIDPSEMQTVLLRTDSDGRTYIQFGNNKTGIIPASGSIIEIRYIDNDGSQGNIASDAIQIQLTTPIYHYYDGNSVLLDVECENTTVAAGGYNTQSLAVLKETSPYVFASGDRAVRREDYKALLINKCGYLTANVWGEYEESIYNGYYDKSMMNLVYYTGIKQLQHYDYKPLGEISDIKLVGQDLLAQPYNFTGNIGTIKGFPGSYILDFTYSLNENIRLRYRDQFGTGILTCDPSENNNDTSLYPFNDLGDTLSSTDSSSGTIRIIKLECEDYKGLSVSAIEDRINANVSPSILSHIAGATGDISEVCKDNTLLKTFVWDGFNSANRAKKMGFDNPVRIYFSFDDTCPTPISAISFRCPANSEALKYCPGRFAVYATNEDPETAPIDQTRNSYYWKRIINVTKLQFNVSTGDEDNWTDWYTTNLYQPDKNLTEEQVYSEVAVLFPQWETYKRYVIEFYTLQSEETEDITYGTPMFIPGIKALYASTNVDYYAWNYISGVYNDGAIVAPNNKYDWEPALVYITTPTVMNNDNPQIYVQTDGEEFPKTTFKHGAIDYQYEYQPWDKENKILKAKLIYKPNDMAFEENNMPDPANYKLQSFRNIAEFAHKEIIRNSIDWDCTPSSFSSAFVNIDKNTYAMKVQESCLHSFVYDGTNWIIDSTDAVNIAEYGIEINSEYEVQTNDTIIVTYNEVSVKYIYDHWYQSLFDDVDNQWHWKEIEGPIVDDKERWYSMCPISDDLTKHNSKGISTINYTNNDLVTLHIPQFPEEMKYYQYNVSVTGAGRNNGYETGDKLYCKFNSTTGEGELYFHVIVKNANANNGNGIVETYFSHSQLESVSNMLLADNTIIDETMPLLYNDQLQAPGEGSGATITIESSPTIKLYAHFTGNSYTLSETQRLDEPIIGEYNHFTTYIEFKQPKIKHTRVVANVEYEDNVDIQQVEGKVRAAIASVFEITPYFIGQDITVNKIWKAIQSVPNIKRFIVTYPVEDIHCEPNELLLLSDSNIIINNIIGTTNIYK